LHTLPLHEPLDPFTADMPAIFTQFLVDPRGAITAAMGFEYQLNIRSNLLILLGSFAWVTLPL